MTALAKSCSDVDLVAHQNSLKACLVIYIARLTYNRPLYYKTRCVNIIT